MCALAARRDTYQLFVMQNTLNVYVYYATIMTTCEVTLKVFQPKSFGLRAQRLHHLATTPVEPTSNTKYGHRATGSTWTSIQGELEPILSLPAAIGTKNGVQRGAVSTLRQG